MNFEVRYVLLRLAMLVTVLTLVFAALRDPARQLEAAAATGLLHLVGVDRVALGGNDGSILVFPSGDIGFRAVVTPSCSALASLLALTVLGELTPFKRRSRRAAALAAALTVIAVGNVIRIAASVGVGFVAGPSSLVLFHDWVASLFSFAYTLGGYVLLLFLLLPANGVPLAARESAHA